MVLVMVGSSRALLQKQRVNGIPGMYRNHCAVVPGIASLKPVAPGTNKNWSFLTAYAG